MLQRKRFSVSVKELHLPPFAAVKQMREYSLNIHNICNQWDCKCLGNILRSELLEAEKLLKP